MNKLISALLLALTVALSGCASYGDADNNIIASNYKAVDTLLGNVALERDQTLLVGTLVNVDTLTESSRLGRIFSEQITSRLAKRGYQVKELKLRDNLFMKQNEGELLLSREVSEVSRAHKAQAVIVGTYASSGRMLFINLKLVNPNGNIILSAHDYALPLDNDVRGLLSNRKTYSN